MAQNRSDSRMSTSRLDSDVYKAAIDQEESAPSPPLETHPHPSDNQTAQLQRTSRLFGDILVVRRSREERVYSRDKLYLDRYFMNLIISEYFKCSVYYICMKTWTPVCPEIRRRRAFTSSKYAAQRNHQNRCTSSLFSATPPTSLLGPLRQRGPPLMVIINFLHSIL